MIKHIVTSKCDRHCPYCISRNVHHKRSKDLEKLRVIYKTIVNFTMDRGLMITGGEPTLVNNLQTIIDIAKDHFFNIYLTTQNPNVITKNLYKGIDAVTFSIHDDYTLYRVHKDIKYPVYASIMADKYIKNMESDIRERGFRGLTINEEQRNGVPFTKRVKGLQNFTCKINRKGSCLNNWFIMPDLKISRGFQEYL